jgi:hypothetical protein
MRVCASSVTVAPSVTVPGVICTTTVNWLAMGRAYAPEDANKMAPARIAGTNRRKGDLPLWLPRQHTPADAGWL